MRQWLAVDVGGTKVAAALVTDSGEVGEVWKQPTQGASNDEMASQLKRALREVCTTANVSPQALAGVGVVLPGRVDRERVMAMKATNLGFNELAVGEVLHQVTPAPVAVENDANAGALGEKWFGAGQGISDFAYVCVGTGVGGGLVLGGHLYVGANGRAGEVGHAVVDLEGARCRCGTIGCPEAAVSGVGLPRLAVRLLGEETANKLGKGEPLAAHHVYLAATSGDSGAKQVVAESGRYLAAIAINMLRILDVERVIFGGGVTAAGKAFTDPIYEGAEQLGYPLRQGLVVLSPLGGKAGLLGAAAVVKEKTARLP